MKRIVFIIIICSIVQVAALAQTAPVTFPTVIKAVSGFDGIPDKFSDISGLIMNDPGIYNKIWKNFYKAINVKDTNGIFKNLQLDFKTFQASDSNRASLGFSYNWDIDLAKSRITETTRSNFAAKINLNGNIAVAKDLNPLDFQQAKLNFVKSGYMGGVPQVNTVELRNRRTALLTELAAITDKKLLAASPLWDSVKALSKSSNQYFYEFSVNGGWEGKQDFSTGQVAGGVQVRLGAKSFTDDNPLAQFNILDYPFALIRALTGTDRELTPYGASLPIVTFGIDEVKPTDDTERKGLTGSDNPYARARFEAAFRTLLACVDKKHLFFNSAYRFFTELGAPAVIKEASLNQFSYFTMSVTVEDAYFISYAYGKLPFDRTNNAVYELGWKTRL